MSLIFNILKYIECKAIILHFTSHCFDLFIEIQLALRITFSLNQLRMRSILKVNSRVKNFQMKKFFMQNSHISNVLLTKKVYIKIILYYHNRSYLHDYDDCSTCITVDNNHHYHHHRSINNHE